MKLDRNINHNQRGKYALLKLRKLDEFTEQGAFGKLAPPIAAAIKILEDAGILDWGNKPETEFFLMRLKDKYATQALQAYAAVAMHDDNEEYADEIMKLAARSGEHSPFCKKPD